MEGKHDHTGSHLNVQVNRMGNFSVCNTVISIHFLTGYVAEPGQYNMMQ